MKINFIGMPKTVSNLMHEYYSPKWSVNHFRSCRCVYHESNTKLPCKFQCESIRWYLYRVTRIRGLIGWIIWRHIIGNLNNILALMKYRVFKQWL